MEDGEIFSVIVVILIYGFPFFLLVFALIIGRYLENAHFKSIRQREDATRNLPAMPTASTDPDQVVAESKLVTGSVVVSLDYFKKFLASFRNIFGGNVQSYQSLLDRAKREAILRVKEQVPEYDVVVNLRVISSNISSVQAKRKGVGGVEVLAFGTAVKYQSASQNQEIPTV